MELMLFYTFCCLGCSAVNDLLFKFFARKDRSRGLFVAAVGVVGTLLFLFLPDKTGENWQMTLLWGIICGIFSAVGNILLIESMSKLSAGVCSTIYRLNLALVVPLSVLIFHETLHYQQLIGVALAIAAVLCFLPGNTGDKKNDQGKRFLPVLMIIIACIFRAGLGVGCKYGPMVGASKNGINLIIEIVWIISGLAYWFFKEKGRYKLDAKLIRYGAVSGILVAGILSFMILALSVGDASVVLPIAQMSFLATFILSVIVLKEKITVFKVLALLCGTGAMLLLT
jgi:uncharacterized membrane protein